MGRKKIPMEKIQHLNYKQVTFSKRRAGLFKKASELCVLCGAEIAIIVTCRQGLLARPPEMQQSEGFWRDAEIEGLGLKELEHTKAAMEKARDGVARRVNEMVLRGASSSGFLEDDVGNVDDQFGHDRATTHCDLVVPYDFGF